MKYHDKGITSEVFTIPSRMKVGDLINKITEIKSLAACKWINSLGVDIETSVVVGAYLSGIGISKRLKEISQVTVIDIYPHLEKLIVEDIEFHSNLTHSKMKMIEEADLVVDTTGLGGLKPQMARSINGKIFLVEDPSSDGSDKTILEKSDIIDRLKLSGSNYKGILKTQGLDSKTSGTMTLTIDILRKSLANILRKPGVLYGVAGMEFYESALFKEKNVEKFLDLMEKPLLTVSTLEPTSCDEIINVYLGKIDSQVENVSL